MAIIIGADGGKLGGPLKALEAAGEALATNHQLQTQARQEQRQNMLDTAGLANQKHIMEMRTAESERQKRDLTLREAENARQEADAQYAAQKRAEAANERVAAKSGSASRLRAFLATDAHNDPSFLGGGMSAEEKRAVKLGMPVETLRELDVLAENAANMSPEDYQASMTDIMTRAKPLVYARRRANVEGLLSTLATESATADGNASPAVIDEKRAQMLKQMLDEGGSPDEVERVLMKTLEAHSKRQAATQINTIRTEGLGAYLANIANAGNDPAVGGEHFADIDALTDAMSIHTAMQKLAPFADPSEIAVMDRQARSYIAGASRDRSSSGSSGSRSGSKDRPWLDKPREAWTRDDAYNDAFYKAIDAKMTGEAAFERADKALQYWDAQRAQAAPPPSAAPAAAGQPAPAAPQAQAQQPQAPQVQPFSKEGTPQERYAAAKAEVARRREAGDMMSAADAKALLEAAWEGRAEPKRTSTSRGDPTTDGQVMRRGDAAKRSVLLEESARDRKRGLDRSARDGWSVKELMEEYEVTKQEAEDALARARK